MPLAAGMLGRLTIRNEDESSASTEPLAKFIRVRFSSGTGDDVLVMTVGSMPNRTASAIVKPSLACLWLGLTSP